MLGAEYGTVSDIEIVWVLLACIGILFSSYNVFCAWGDLRWFLKLKLPPNGRRDIAISTVIVESARLVILSIFLAIGIVSMTIPDVDPKVLPTNLVVAGILIRWGLIGSSCLMIVQSIVNANVRRRSKVRAQASAAALVHESKTRREDG